MNMPRQKEKWNLTCEFPTFPSAEAAAQEAMEIMVAQKIIVNDHGPRQERDSGRYLIAIQGCNRLSMFPFDTPHYFSMNGLYVGDDGKVHLSTISNGGTVLAGETPQQMVTAFNAKQDDPDNRIQALVHQNGEVEMFKII
jgi:hypothetical protein